MTNALSLASYLSALPDDELAALIDRRNPTRSRISDFFDLSEALLDQVSIQAALAPLERPVLADLARLVTDAEIDVADAATAARLERLAALALVEPSGSSDPAAAGAAEPPRVYDAVRERLESWPHEGLPSTSELIEAPMPVPPGVDSDRAADVVDRAAAERAFHTIGAFAELVFELDREPARELQKGGISLPDGRRLATAMSVEPGDVPHLVWLAQLAGLVSRDHLTWLATERSAEWLAVSTTERWRAVAEAWLESLPGGVRTLLAGHSQLRWGSTMHDALRWFLPAAGEALARNVARAEALGELIGVSSADTPSSAGIALVTDGAAAASEILAALLPDEVEQVYVQHDLTIVSPGPLSPAVDTRLRRFAELESRALASTFRVTSASLERAIASGETEASIREFLGTVSLTGIPQPLDYLITESATRYGLIRVRDASSRTATRTLVHSSNTALIDAIAVDQSFTPLALGRAEGGVLASRFARDIVYWALADAKYPVAAEDPSGAIVGVQRRRATTAQPVSLPDQTAELVRRLRTASSTEGAGSGEAWMSRQLEAAVRARAPVVVSVAMPDGSTIDLTLEPTGVGGGRLRGRDRRSDIERTLPLRSIRAVHTI